jgi:hypothetical protein
VSESPKNHTPHGPLASARGHLAGRFSTPPENGNGRHAKPALTKTARELEANARMLAKTGMDSGDIARALGQYGVTSLQVTQWLGNAPPATESGP